MQPTAGRAEGKCPQFRGCATCGGPHTEAVWELSDPQCLTPVRHIPPERTRYPPSSSVLPGFKPLVTPGCESTRRLGPSLPCGISNQVGVEEGGLAVGVMVAGRLGWSVSVSTLGLPSGSFFRTQGGHENSCPGNAACSGEPSEHSSEVVSQTYGGQVVSWPWRTFSDLLGSPRVARQFSHKSETVF